MTARFHELCEVGHRGGHSVKPPSGCVCVCRGEKESIFEFEQVFVLECVCICACVRRCLCDCRRKLEGKIRRIQGDRCLFSFFLRVGGGISDHQRPTFHKFILSRKRNRHFCVIPCHITHCLLVITNAEREIERTESRREEQLSCSTTFGHIDRVCF